jgi:hypothetical protein
MVGMALTPTIEATLPILEEAGCHVRYDRDQGTVIARDGDVVVYRAIQEGPRGPWIVRMSDSDRIHWSRSH